MARETRTRSGRVSKFGMCVNEECEMYKQVQEITHGDFICEKCQKPLTSCPPPTKKGNKGMLIGIVAAIVAVLAIICIFLFSGGPKVEKLILDKDSVSMKPGQTEKLIVTIEPEGVKPELIWKSSDEAVVTVQDGVITAKAAGKATVSVAVKDNETVSAECECIVVEKDIDMETLDIQEDPLVLRPGGYQQLTVKFTPEDQTETISFTSSNDSIATVSPRGKVEAIKVGKVIIIAKSDRTGVADTAKVSVEGPAETPEDKNADSKTPVATPAPKAQSSAPAPKPTTSAAFSGTKNLGYATFKGSWPNDVNGRMVFKSSHVIDSKDPKKRVAEAGDYVIGEWSDGHLVQGIWYGADNQVKGSVIIGK